MNNYFKMLFFSTVFFLFCFLNAKNVLKIRKMWGEKNHVYLQTFDLIQSHYRPVRERACVCVCVCCYLFPVSSSPSCGPHSALVPACKALLNAGN